jgi:chromosome segregation ATPase
METQTLEIRPRNLTAPAQVVPVEQAVKSLVQIRSDQRAWAAEKEKRDRELAEANRRAVELQDEHARLRKVVADLLSEIAHAEHDLRLHAERIPVLERELEHFWTSGTVPHDHIHELQWRTVIFERLPAWLAQRKEKLPDAVAALSAFEKTHLQSKK